MLAGGSQGMVRSQASSSSLGLQYRTWAETAMGQVMRRLWSLTYKQWAQRGRPDASMGLDSDP